MFLVNKNNLSQSALVGWHPKKSAVIIASTRNSSELLFHHTEISISPVGWIEKYLSISWVVVRISINLAVDERRGTKMWAPNFNQEQKYFPNFCFYFFGIRKILIGFLKFIITNGIGNLFIFIFGSFYGKFNQSNTEFFYLVDLLHEKVKLTSLGVKVDLLVKFRSRVAFILIRTTEICTIQSTFVILMLIYFCL